MYDRKCKTCMANLNNDASNFVEMAVKILSSLLLATSLSGVIALSCIINIEERGFTGTEQINLLYMLGMFGFSVFILLQKEGKIGNWLIRKYIKKGSVI